MYQVTIKGKDLPNFKKALSDFHEQFSGGKIIVSDEVPNAVTTIVEEVKQTTLQDVPVTTLPEGMTVNENPLAETLIQPAIAAVENVISGVDVEGISWDSRIHTDKKTKTAKGIWKLKRNIDKALVAQVKAEQLGGAAQTAPVVTTPTPAPVVATPTPAAEASPVPTPVPTAQPSPEATSSGSQP